MRDEAIRRDIGVQQRAEFLSACAGNTTAMAKGKNVSVQLTGLAVAVSGGSAVMMALRPLRDDHPCYHLVGQIAAQTARIERMLDQSICAIAEIDLKVGASITGQMIGPTPRFNALHQLASNRAMSLAILKRIKATSGRANIHFERRNRAVHDPWLEDSTTGVSYQDRGKPKSQPDFGPMPVSDKELKDTLLELKKYREEVTDLVSDIWLEMHSS